MSKSNNNNNNDYASACDSAAAAAATANTDSVYKNYNFLNINNASDDDAATDGDDELPKQKTVVATCSTLTMNSSSDDENEDDEEDEDGQFVQHCSNEDTKNSLYKLNNKMNRLFSYYHKHQQQHDSLSLLNKNQASKTYTSCLKKNVASSLVGGVSAAYEDHVEFERHLNETIAVTTPILNSAAATAALECICVDNTVAETSGVNLQLIALPNSSLVTTSGDTNYDVQKSHVNKHILTSSFNISSSQSGNGTNHSLFKDITNASKILEGLNKLRESKSLCDVVIKVDGEEFCCHKCVLASLSNYFTAMFSGELVESRQSQVQINNIDALTMKLIIDYAYTSDLDIHENNVQALLTAANLFDVKSIKDACCRYMELNMDPSNCVGIHCFSESHDCMELKNISFSYILNNFCKVILYDEYLTLQKSKVIEIISDDNLNVPNEDIVFNACIRWLDFASAERTQEFHRILEHIRLPLLSAYFLYDKVQSEERIKECDKSRELIQEAMMYNLLKDRRNQVQNERTRSRKSFSHLEALVVVGGEDDRVVLRTVDAYFPALDRWMPLQCSPYALSKHGVVACGENMLYMAGGEAPDSTPNETLWVFNTILDEWKQLANLIVPRAELGMAIVDGCVYAVGGITTEEKRLQTIERYDPLLNQWKNCANMKVAISSPAVCSLNGLLYVCGGTVGEPGELVDLVQCYNPASDTWKELSPMLIPRTGCAACALNGLIYVIGGWYADDENSNRVEYYDAKLDKWLLCKSMIERRHRPAVAVLNNRIYVCGGEESFNLYHDTIECYDASINEWQIVTCMNNGRSWLSCTTLRLQNPLFDNNDTVAASSYLISTTTGAAGADNDDQTD